MCYDISFTVNIPQLSDYFPDLVFDEQLSLFVDGTHIMGHAFGAHPIIYRNRDDRGLHVRGMEWGCIPFHIKDEKAFAPSRATMLVARSERVLRDDKSYWYKIRNRRCLIPTTGIYEHRAVRGWKKKVPYFIRLKSQPMFFLPGLYSVAELPDTSTGEMIRRWTFTLITRPANSVMAQIHNSGDNSGRMPLFLPFEQSLSFLNTEVPTPDYEKILHYELPSEELDYHPVFTIRSAKLRPDDKAKNEYWEWDKLPALGTMDPDMNN